MRLKNKFKNFRKLRKFFLYFPKSSLTANSTDF